MKGAVHYWCHRNEAERHKASNKDIGRKRGAQSSAKRDEKVHYDVSVLHKDENGNEIAKALHNISNKIRMLNHVCMCVRNRAVNI